MKATQFKAGVRSGKAAQHWVPIGSLRVNSDGYLDRKVREDHGSRNWVCVHRLVWEEANGPTPAGHAVVFKPGRRTTSIDQITLDALELVTRAELMRRNTIHRYPRELKQAIRLVGKLRRTIEDRA